MAYELPYSLGESVESVFRMEPDTQEEIMVHWYIKTFGERHTVLTSAILENEFGGQVSSVTVSRASEEIARYSSGHYLNEQGRDHLHSRLSKGLGTPAEIAVRNEISLGLKELISDIDRLIDYGSNSSFERLGSKIGHNNPPPDKVKQKFIEAATALDEEVSKVTPDTRYVEVLSNSLKLLRGEIVDISKEIYTQSKKMAAKAASAGIIGTSIYGAGQISPALNAKLETIFQLISKWFVALLTG